MHRFSDRLAHMLNVRDLNQAEAADRTGLHQNCISHYITGKREPGLESLHAILLGFPDVDARWLITGVRNDAS